MKYANEMYNYTSPKNVRVSILHIFGKTLFGAFVAATVGRAMSR